MEEDNKKNDWLDVLTKLIAKLNKAKLATIIMFIILLVGFVYSQLGFKFFDNLNINFNNYTAVEKTIERKKEPPVNDKKKQSVRQSIKIEKLYLTPTRFENNNYMYFRIRNNGNASLNNVKTSIDFGQATIFSREFRQMNKCEFTSNNKTSVQELTCSEINPNEIIDIQFILDTPTFSSISASSEKGIHDKIKFENYQLSLKETDDLGFYGILFRILFTCVACAYVFKWVVNVIRDTFL